jgi:hypothetical protein
MKQRIKATMKRLQRTKKPPTYYLEKLDYFLSNPSKENWINTGQYQNSFTFKKKYPEFSITKGVKQIIFYAGEYIVELLPDNVFRWDECIFSSLNDVEDCIWEKENKNYE